MVDAQYVAKNLDLSIFIPHHIFQGLRLDSLSIEPA